MLDRPILWVFMLWCWIAILFLFGSSIEEQEAASQSKETYCKADFLINVRLYSTDGETTGSSPPFGRKHVFDGEESGMLWCPFLPEPNQSHRRSHGSNSTPFIENWKRRSRLPLAEPLKNCPSLAGMLPLSCIESQEDWCCVTGSRWDVLWQLCSATAGWQMSWARQRMRMMTRVEKRSLGCVVCMRLDICADHLSLVLTHEHMFTIWMACWNIQPVIQDCREMWRFDWFHCTEAPVPL